MKSVIKIIFRIWSLIINNGVRPGLNFDQIAQIRISNAISVIGSLFAMTYAIVLASMSAYNLAMEDIYFVVNMLLIYLFNRLNLYRIGTGMAFISVPAALLLVNYKYGVIGTEYYFFSSIVLCFYYYKKPINQYLNVLYFIGLVFLTKYLERIVAPDEIANRLAPYILYSNIIMSLSLLVMVVSLFINEHKRYQLEIVEKNIQLNEALADSKVKNEQVNMMLKELNHRVKNNLQMISSLFNIQSYKTKNKETKNALNDARNRIVSIAIMHQKLYKENHFHEVNLKKYVDDLLNYLIYSVSTTKTIDVQVNADEVMLRIEDMVHVGLIINELVTNAIKYGTTSKNDRNEIHIAIRYNKGILTIEVSDNGNGFPENYDLKASDSFGIELINNIVEQHEGSIAIKNENGAKVKIELKITEFRD